MFPFWTEEDIAEEFKLLDKYKEIVRDLPTGDKEKAEKIWEQYIRLDEERATLTRKVEQKYTNSFSDEPSRIFDDIREVVKLLEKDDYLARREAIRQIIKEKLEEGDTIAEPLKAQLDNEYATAYDFVLWTLRPQINVLAYYKIDEDLAITNEIIDSRVKEWLLEEAEGDIDISFNASAEVVSYRHPTNYIQNLTKTHSRIFDLSFEQLSQISFDVSPNKGKLDPCLVLVDVAPDDSLQGIEKLTKFDKTVHNSICSIFISNPTGFFTPKQVATFAYYGDNPNNNNPSKQQIGAVTKSIEKLRHIDLAIDYTEHAKQNKKLPEGTEQLRVKNYIIPAMEYQAKLNGATLTGYKLLAIPPMLQYGQFTGQLSTHSAKLLSVPVNLSTEEKVALRDYLLEQIGHINKNKSWNTTLTIDRILLSSGYNLEDLSRTQKSRLIDTIRTMLKDWTTKGAIQGYRENYTGKSLTSITITPL